MPTFTGDAGDNLIDRSLSAVADSIDGAGGNDTLLAGSSIDTLVGGTGNDSLSGGNGADKLRGDDGNDTLAGAAGNDTADGGLGLDTLFGGGGNDSLLGGDGDDSLLGHDGLDSLTGGNGRDTLDGGDRDDLLYGGQQDDSLIGGAGNDSLLGSNSNDTALGGSGNDTLDGGAGLDVLTGGQGADVLIGGIGADRFVWLGNGAGGNDPLESPVSPSGHDRVLDFEQGVDKLDLAALRGAADLTWFDLDAAGAGAAHINGVWYAQQAGATLVFADVGGDGAADIEIELAGLIDLDHADFLGINVAPVGSIDLANLVPSQGFVIHGAEAGDLSGYSVSSAGDVNGDGFDDLILGARHADAAGNAKLSAGESYVIFGKADGFGASIDLATLTPAQGFIIYGADSNDRSGRSVSAAGDVNGDGFDDLIIGADRASGVGSAADKDGESFVIFGKAAGFGAGLDLAVLTPAQGFVIQGADSFDFLGTSVSSAGDVNGDGFDDLIVGAPEPSLGSGVQLETGESYVIFGTDAGFAARIDAATLTAPQGFVVRGADVYDNLGWSVSSAGDVNGDGFDDLVIGAFGGDGPANAGVRHYTGETYVVFGTDSGFESSLDVEALTPAQGFVIFGVEAYDSSGRSVSAAGDVNGDGFDDLIIGAPRADAAGNAKSEAGESYVIFGRDEGFGSSIHLVALTPEQGFVIFGANADDHSGHSVSSAGDVNGDGFDDLIIGALAADSVGNAKSSAGESYLIFGTDAGFGAGIDLASLAPSQGFVIFGADANDFAGRSVSAAGDINGDGFDDLILGADQADAAGNAKDLAGDSYVIYGADFRSETAQIGGSSNDSITGTSAHEILVAGQGDDTVNGAGGDDVVQGGAGNDSINGGGGADSLDGGSGHDVLQGGTGNDTIHGGDGDDRLNGLAGDDRLLGGDGDDVFVIKSGNGTDIIVDFVPGAASGDIIDLTGVGSAINSFADVQANATAVGSSTEIDLGGGEKLVLLAFQPSDLVASDFLI
jgi:Ca2+-binding RTX toxin-like protein